MPRPRNAAGSPAPPARWSTRKAGARVERRAAWLYRLRGYRILATNAWAGGYEIDLVARRGRRLVFCEVKSKSGSGFGQPVEMVGPEKRRRLERAAETWLAAHRELAELEVVLEVVGVGDRGLTRVPLN